MSESSKPPIKTCDYCRKNGYMPTFRDGETSCLACLKVLPETAADGRRKVHEQEQTIKSLTEEVEQLKANEQRYIEALDGLVRLKAYKDQHGKDDWYDEQQPKAWDIARQALAQSPQQVEVYRTGQAVIDAAINWDSHTPTRVADERRLIIAVANHRFAIDKADKGE